MRLALLTTLLFLMLLKLNIFKTLLIILSELGRRLSLLTLMLFLLLLLLLEAL